MKKRWKVKNFCSKVEIFFQDVFYLIFFSKCTSPEKGVRRAAAEGACTTQYWATNCEQWEQITGRHFAVSVAVALAILVHIHIYVHPHPNPRRGNAGEEDNIDVDIDMDIDGLQMSLPAMKHEAEEQHPSSTDHRPPKQQQLLRVVSDFQGKTNTQARGMGLTWPKRRWGARSIEPHELWIHLRWPGGGRSTFEFWVLDSYRYPSGNVVIFNWCWNLRFIWVKNNIPKFS